MKKTPKKSKSRLKKFVLTAGYRYESPYSGYSHNDQSGPHTILALNRETAERKLERLLWKRKGHIEYFTWFRDEAEMAAYEENFLY